MVVLSVGICTRAGQAIISRQFISMPRSRVEMLYSSFPKLLTADLQHSFIESNSVRYVFQCIETLYLIIITNKASNLIEDLDTLRLIASLIPQYCGSHDESSIKSHAFELVFAIDEVISLGYREQVSLTQIISYTEMNSTSEQLHEMIMENKMIEARDEAKRKAKLIDAKKNEIKKALAKKSGPRSISSDNIDNEPIVTTANVTATPSTSTWKSTNPTVSKVVNKGMKLSKKKDNRDILASSLMENTFSKPEPTISHVPSSNTISEESILINIKEQVSVSLESDGTLRKMELKGMFSLIVMIPDVSRIMISVTDLNKFFQYTTHPKLDKNEFNSSSTLVLKDKNKAFPVGSSSATTLLKWRASSNDSNMVPLNVTFWSEDQGNRSVINMEYSMQESFLDYKDFVLNNVSIVIPCKCNEPPTISSCDGDVDLNARDRELIWNIDNVSLGDSGTLEFSVPQIDSDLFYPISISFVSQNLFSGIKIANINHAIENEKELPFIENSLLESENYLIE